MPKFNLKQKWNGSYGKEYEYLTSQANQLQERNEEKLNWIDIYTCETPPGFDECDLEALKVAKSVQRWMNQFFRRYRKAERARPAAYKLMKHFDQLWRKSSRLDHKVKDKHERCKKELYEIKGISSKNFLSRSIRSPCPGKKLIRYNLGITKFWAILLLMFLLDSPLRFLNQSRYSVSSRIFLLTNLCF